MSEITAEPISVGIELPHDHEVLVAERPRKLHSHEQSYEHDIDRAHHIALAEAAFRAIDDHHVMLRDRPLREKLLGMFRMYYSVKLNRSLAREMEVRGGLIEVHETAGQEYDDMHNLNSAQV